MPEIEYESEEFEEEPSKIVTLFEDFFEHAQQEIPDMTLNDIDLIECVIYIKLRSLFTIEQMHQRAHEIILRAESILHEPGALRDAETGEVATPLLVENFQGTAEEYLEMMQGEITDDDIAGLLTGEEQ